MLKEYESLIFDPLTDAELEHLAKILIQGGVYNPGYRFRIEATREIEEIEKYTKSPKCPHYIREFFDGQAGKQRRVVIARRNVRLRWERLGVWNPKWGIPGRRPDAFPEDDTWGWRWAWQKDFTLKWWPELVVKVEEDSVRLDNRPDGKPYNDWHPANRAVQMRKGLSFAEFKRYPPHLKLPKDASTAQGDAFIISRPWFQYTLERAEWDIRVDRAFKQIINHYTGGFFNSELGPGEEHRVTQVWKQRGEWKHGWNKTIEDLTETTVGVMENIVGWMWLSEEDLEDKTPDELGGFTGPEALAIAHISPIYGKIPTLRELEETKWHCAPDEQESMEDLSEMRSAEWIENLPDPEDMEPADPENAQPAPEPEDTADMPTLEDVFPEPEPVDIDAHEEDLEGFEEGMEPSAGDTGAFKGTHADEVEDTINYDRKVLRELDWAMRPIYNDMGEWPIAMGPLPHAMRAFVRAKVPFRRELGPWPLAMGPDDVAEGRVRVATEPVEDDVD